MGRLKIKSKVRRKKVKEPYYAKINEIKEWQDNVYNPGHYIGTGRMPMHWKAMSKRPALKYAYLLYLIIPIVVALFTMKFVWYQVVPVIIIGAVIIYIVWDSNRVIKKKYKS